jgi:hypothetical protein
VGCTAQRISAPDAGVCRQPGHGAPAPGGGGLCRWHHLQRLWRALPAGHPAAVPPCRPTRAGSTLRVATTTARMAATTATGARQRAAGPHRWRRPVRRLPGPTVPLPTATRPVLPSVRRCAVASRVTARTWTAMGTVSAANRGAGADAGQVRAWHGAQPASVCAAWRAARDQLYRPRAASAMNTR